MRPFPWMMMAAVLLAGPALAETGGKGKDGKEGKGPPDHAMPMKNKDQDHGGVGGFEPEDHAAGRANIGVLVSAAQRSLIQQYFGASPMRAEPLPPGIAKNVARGKPLPPGIAKKMPDDLQSRLVAPPGHVYQVVGGDVVLLHAATNVVVEVLRGMLR